MISIVELFFESSKEFGGMVARSLSFAAVPVPGAGFFLAPVASRVGEFTGGLFPNIKKVPAVARDSVKIYSSAGEKNGSFSPQNQIDARRSYIDKAKTLGYNTAGQTVAAIDPSLISIIPNTIIKK